MDVDLDAWLVLTRAATSSRWTSTRCFPGARRIWLVTLSDAPVSRAGWSRTSRSTSSELPRAHRRESRFPVVLTGTPLVLSRRATARPCSSTSTTTPGAAAGEVPGPGVWSDEPAQGDQGQPHGQARVPLGLLERADARTSDAHQRLDVHGRQGRSRVLTPAPPRIDLTRSTQCQSRPSTATRSTSTTKAS